MPTFKQTKTVEGLARISIYNNTLRIQYTHQQFFKLNENLTFIFSFDLTELNYWEYIYIDNKNINVS